MSKRAFSRSFDMPTVDPDKEDEMFEEGETVILREYFAAPFNTHEQHLKHHMEAVAKNAIDHVLRSAIKCPVIEKVAKSGCDHSWTSYTGLSESFEFCKHCDKRK